jgi:hypothetical protein
MFTNSSKLLATTALSLTSLMMGCSPANFNSVPNTKTAVNDNSCKGTSVGSITRLTKILFVVDQSGSNNSETMEHGTRSCDGSVVCTPATDPTKSFRGGAIQNFLNKYNSKTNFNWGFITFTDNSAKSLITAGGSPYLTGNPGEFQSAIGSFLGIADGGATPYQAALRTAKNTIQSDRDLSAASQPQYFVIFLTDGFPTDYQDWNGSFNSASMQSDLNALLSVAPGRVSLSTVYYGQADDPDAMTLLQNMARQGSGQFARASDTSTAINIDDVIPGSQKPCP